MAVNINSLVRTIGGQEKVIDKDKALIELANAIENGGGEQQKRIVSCWKSTGGNIEKIDILDNAVTITDGVFIFTTDENEPNLDFKNVALSINMTDGVVVFSSFGIILEKNTGFILVFENIDKYKIEDNYLRIIWE